MTLIKTIRPINSLIFISDADGGDPPIPVRGARILSTPSCISVVCFPEQDGPTQVVLGRICDVEADSSPVFDGDLSTPSRVVVISTAEYEKVLETKVPNTATHVRVWTNHPIWPAKVIIGLDDTR